MERPFFFERGQRDSGRLFVVSHRPPAPHSKVGVVFCHPYGEEKQFSHPVLVRFARLLSAEGIPSLRFDSRGYGDSPGNLEDATLASQLADTRDAMRCAIEELGVERLVLLGLRLGATTAALIAEKESGVDGLVLWSPIVSGSSYVRELARKKVFAQLAFGGESLTVDNVLGILASEGRVDIEGNYLTQAMSRELAEIDLAAQIQRFCGPVFVSTIEDPRQRYEPFESLATTYGRRANGCRVDVIGQTPFWDRSFLYKQAFPAELYRRTMDWMIERWIVT